MSRLTRMLAAFGLLGLAAALSVQAADAASESTADSAFPDIQRILDAGVVRVAIMAEDAPPMIMTAEDGGPAGAEADLARDLAEKLGVEVEFVRSADTYDGVVEQIAAQEADLGISFLSSSVVRALRVYFSRPYINQSGRVFYNRTAFAQLKRDYKIETLRDVPRTAAVDSVQFGVLEGSVYETMLERDFPKIRIKRYSHLEELMQAVRNGETFAGVHGGLQLAFYMRQHSSTAIHVAIDQEARSPSDICIAVRPDAPNLLGWVNVFLATNVGLQESADIVDRYIEQSPPDEDE